MDRIVQVSTENYSNIEIPVEFVVLHYTATTLKRTLEIFQDPERKASSHLVIDRDGTVYEVVPCLSGKVCRAWHAGVSRYIGREGFNDFSVGIELVNLNGNVFPYTDGQYDSLARVIEKLKTKYPSLGDPARLVGHEEIADFRGKSDPGILFDWARLYKTLYGGEIHPSKPRIVTERLAAALNKIYSGLGISLDSLTGEFQGIEAVSRMTLESISELLEAAVEAGRKGESGSK